MSPSPAPTTVEDYRRFQVLWEEGERRLCRAPHSAQDGANQICIVAQLIAEQPTRDGVGRLAHEFELRDYLDRAWALRPLEIVQRPGRNELWFEYPGGELLERLIGAPMEMGRFLRLAIGIANAMGQMHEQGLVHRDIKAANIFVDEASCRFWLTGFGVASRLQRERQPMKSPELIAGTLSHMAPEQTGRINRSIDSRSDLYSLGVTLYHMLTCTLPFMAAEPMEWIHWHIAKMPPSPTARRADVPPQLSALVMKLLAKIPEDRYQTARGVEHDLQRCLDDWQSQCAIDEFPLGTCDTPGRLMITEKLYGRTREVEALLAAFDRVAESGGPEFILISGHSGLGKSALVHKVHEALVFRNGIFASGKCDQYKGDVPHLSLTEALQSLLQPLLAKNESQLANWRQALQEVLAHNAQLMADLIPDLKLIIGEQPAVSVLAPHEAQRRYFLVIHRFLSVFAEPGHPLVLFIDDLQWVDAATLHVLEDLMVHGAVRHLLFIGAYRNDEVDLTHPLMRVSDRIRNAGTPVHHVSVRPLTRIDVADLVADSLHCDRERAAQLAKHVHRKTAGNPFFVIQFLSMLVEEELVTFDRGAACWSWDLSRIHEKGYTDNVVDFMLTRLNRISAHGRGALKRLACLGNRVELERINLAFPRIKEKLHRNLQEAVRAGLVIISGDCYLFLHDQVQEAAYSLISHLARARIHLYIGRRLLMHTPTDRHEEIIFEIVGHLTKGAALIVAQHERQQLAELNLIGAKRAKTVAAYESALKYLVNGIDLVSDETDPKSDVKFLLELNRAECEFLLGQLPEAEQRLDLLAQRAVTHSQRSAVACLRLDLFVVLGVDRAIQVCLDYVELLGIKWQAHPTDLQARGAYEKMMALLGDSPVPELINLPTMRDAESLAIFDVLTRAGDVAYMLDQNLWVLIYSFLVELSFERGNSENSPIAYVNAGIAAIRFEDYERGYLFGKLGNELTRIPRYSRHSARTSMTYGYFILPWKQHLRLGRPLIQGAITVCRQTGDVTNAAYACINAVVNLLAAGEALDVVQRETEEHQRFTQKLKFKLATGQITSHLMLIRSLRGLTAKFGHFDEDGFSEKTFEQTLIADPQSTIVLQFYLLRKLQARFFAGDFASALDTAQSLESNSWRSPSIYWKMECTFYIGLCHAAVLDIKTLQSCHFRPLIAASKQLNVWSAICPENFDPPAMLLSAEVARVQGRDIDAQRFYECALKSSQHGAFVHFEALASELAARYYCARDLHTVAKAYMLVARQSYHLWGARGKVSELDAKYSYLRNAEVQPDLLSVNSTSTERLDLASVLSVSQAVSSEIDIEKLIGMIMRLAVEHAGAERGLLILPSGIEYCIEAEAKIEGNAVAVNLRQIFVDTEQLPTSVFNFVVRTKEYVILADASSRGNFSDDDYFRLAHPRSVLCLPLMKQTRLIGIIYLENRLNSDVFTAERLALIKLLASEAAVSLENARLYRELQKREIRVKRLFDANIIGIFTWNLDGRLIDVNEAFTKISGYSMEDVASGKINLKGLTRPESGLVDIRDLMGALKTGVIPSVEAEYVRKDGSCVPVLIGAALFDEASSEGVAFVMDLSARKKAERHARDSERQYRDMEIQLNEANRVASISELSASIAHEINQPLLCVNTNAATVRLLLAAAPPDIDGAQAMATRIIDDCDRAADVIRRLRVLFTDAELMLQPMDLNDAAQEVIGMTSADVERNKAVLRVELANQLPLVLGVRIQLQQVMLNLIRNSLEAMIEVEGRPRRLTITTEAEDNKYVRMTVSDEGIGINKKHIHRLFEAFFTTKSGGMGVGLSVSRSIIERHNGRLWAEPNSDHGMRFIFCIRRHV